MKSRNPIYFTTASLDPSINTDLWDAFRLHITTTCMGAQRRGNQFQASSEKSFTEDLGLEDRA